MSTTTIPVPPTTCHILLVDDDDMIRVLFQEMFWIYSHNNTSVSAVRSIEEAYEYIKSASNQPNIVVLGLSLLTKGPFGFSHEVTPSLKFIEDIKLNNEHMKIVVYSHHAEEDLKEKAKEAGADAYLVKGQYTPKEMVDFIENLQ